MSKIPTVQEVPKVKVSPGLVEAVENESVRYALHEIAVQVEQLSLLVAALHKDRLAQPAPVEEQPPTRLASVSELPARQRKEGTALTEDEALSRRQAARAERERVDQEREAAGMTTEREVSARRSSSRRRRDQA